MTVAVLLTPGNGKLTGDASGYKHAPSPADALTQLGTTDVTAMAALWGTTLQDGNQSADDTAKTLAEMTAPNQLVCFDGTTGQVWVSGYPTPSVVTINRSTA
jgi:hypothetical protein